MANLYFFYTTFKTAQVFCYHSETLQLEAAALKMGGTVWQPKLRILWSNYFLLEHKHTASAHTQKPPLNNTIWMMVISQQSLKAGMSLRSKVQSLFCTYCWQCLKVTKYSLHLNLINFSAVFYIDVPLEIILPSIII